MFFFVLFFSKFSVLIFFTSSRYWNPYRATLKRTLDALRKFSAYLRTFVWNATYKQFCWKVTTTHTFFSAFCCTRLTFVDTGGSDIQKIQGDLQRLCQVQEKIPIFVHLLVISSCIGYNIDVNIGGLIESTINCFYYVSFSGTFLGCSWTAMFFRDRCCVRDRTLFPWFPGQKKPAITWNFHLRSIQKHLRTCANTRMKLWIFQTSLKI